MLARVSHASRKVVVIESEGLGESKWIQKSTKSSLSWRIQERRSGFGVSLSVEQVVAGGQG